MISESLIVYSLIQTHLSIFSMIRYGFKIKFVDCKVNKDTFKKKQNGLLSSEKKLKKNILF